MSIFEEMLDNEFGIEIGEGPFYTSYLVDVQEDYPNIGLKSCPWNSVETPKLYLLKDELIEHFNFIYKYREIGSETEERWQYTVDRIFDNIKRKYEFALTMYDDNLIMAVGKTYSEQINRNTNNTSVSTSSSEYADNRTGTNTAKNKVNDRPIQSLIETGEYASLITDDTVDFDNDSTGTTENEGNNTFTGSDIIIRTRSDKDASTIELVNDIIDKFRDLIDMFVDEFNKCFMSTLGRI